MSISSDATPAPGSPDSSNAWVQWRAIGALLRPTLLQIGAALLPAGAYFASDQGKEILSMLGEALSWHSGALSSAICFIFGTFLAGFANWWTARVMMEFVWEPLPEPVGKLGSLRIWLQRYWPRVLGITPVVIIAAAIFARILDYTNPDSTPSRWSLFWLGMWHLAVAGALLLYFWGRRQRLDHASARRFESFGARDNSSIESRYINWGLLTVSALTLFAVWADPEVVAPALGTGAMLSLAAVAWVTIGTRLVYVRARSGVPVVSIIVAWVFLNSCWMDNHQVRLSGEYRPLNAGRTVQAAFTDWRNGLAGVGPISKPPRLRPVFIVATEGGGIRAAYWTATVLGALEVDSIQAAARSKLGIARPPDFASHLFAISGVSGGSVGAAVFDALLADKRPELWREAEQILGRDHLAPLLGGLLFPDALQRAIPRAVPGTDRGAILEKSWERAYREVTGGSDRLAQPFRDLWPKTPAQNGSHLPHLLLNSTMVGTGQRVIFSDLAITSDPQDGEFPDAVDARTVLFKKDNGTAQPWDVPLSTAAHASARFTYTNPAGLLNTGQRVVDGGYFENSGSLTAVEVLQVVEGQTRVDADAAERIVPVVILISNNPERQVNGHKNVWTDDVQAELQKRLGSVPDPANGKSTQDEQGETADFKATRPKQFASELLSPPRALLATSSARATLAIQETIRHQIVSGNALEDVAHPPLTITFHLVDDGIPLPLGWSLSNTAAGDMQGQMWGPGNSGAEGDVLAWLQLAAGP